MQTSKLLGDASFLDSFDWVFFRFDTLNVSDLHFDGTWVEGSIEAKYVIFSQGKEDSFGFKVEINQTTDVDYGILVVPVHVWLDGPKLWIGCG